MSIKVRQCRSNVTEMVTFRCTRTGLVPETVRREPLLAKAYILDQTTHCKKLMKSLRCTPLLISFLCVVLRNVSEPVYGRQTSNSAEIQAATHAIRSAKSAGELELAYNPYDWNHMIERPFCLHRNLKFLGHLSYKWSLFHISTREGQCGQPRKWGTKFMINAFPVLTTFHSFWSNLTFFPIRNRQGGNSKWFPVLEELC